MTIIKDKNINKLKIGDIITLKIGAIAHGGHFISRYENLVIFVRHAISDEIAKVKITHIKKKLAFGNAIEIIKPSKHRVNPPCKYAKPEGCGGCDFQHISVTMQKNLKGLVIKDLFKKIAGIEIEIKIISSEPHSGLNWRTRLDLAISKNHKVGLYSHKSKEVIEIDKCLIAVNAINKLNIFNKNWDYEDRLNISASSEDKITINKSDKIILGSKVLKEIVGEYTFNISSNTF